MSTTAEPPIVDDTEHHRFTAQREGGTAELLYREDGDRLILVHTGVPAELGGRGLGGRLVQAGIERASADGLVVVPWCPFARRWLREHADVAAGVSIDWTSQPDG